MVKVTSATSRVACSGAIISFYIFSFGPVLRLCGARVGDGWPSLPQAVRFVYAPLGVAGSWFPMWYEHYISFWLLERPSPRAY